MSGRRRDSRFLLSAPVSGHLHVREEVVIEKWSDVEIEVLSTVPSSPNEQLALELPGDAGGQVAVTVRESRVIVAPDGSIRYRLRMSPDPAGLPHRPEKGQRES